MAKDLRELSDEELAERLADTRKELFNLRFQSATGALENSDAAEAWPAARSPASSRSSTREARMREARYRSSMAEKKTSREAETPEAEVEETDRSPPELPAAEAGGRG